MTGAIGCPYIGFVVLLAYPVKIAADFRYRPEKDKMTGNDLLQEMVVVKPYGKAGWYAVDLHHHYIPVSSPGFFIAMEGVFPNDYDFYAQGDDFTDIAKTSPETEIEDSPTMISYGQRLGYTKSRRNENNTWHYSLDHTWFQLKKQLFSVMVAADIIMLEKPHKEE